MKWLKILIVKVAEFGSPSTNNIDRQVFYYVFWSILSQMRHVCCRIFKKKKKKKIFLNLYALWWNFPCQLRYQIGFSFSFSQTMYFRVSYSVRYYDKTPKICCFGLFASYFTPKNVWYNLSTIYFSWEIFNFYQYFFLKWLANFKDTSINFKNNPK